jgi:hypothetical protein
MPAEVAGELQREARRQQPGVSGSLVHLDSFRTNAAESRRASAGAPRRKSDRPPSWDRPSYLRVVK